MMVKTDKMPDEQADEYDGPEDVIAWAFINHKLICGQAARHRFLIEERFDLSPGNDLGDAEGLMGYVLGDKIVSWQEPTVKELDALWKKFGCLDVEYYESMSERLAFAGK